MKKFTSREEIMQSANDRLLKAEDKGAMLLQIASELSEAISAERVGEFEQFAKNAIEQGMRPADAGCRKLNQSENKFYDGIKQSLEKGIDIPQDTIIPTTVINRVFEDLSTNYKLMELVSIAPVGTSKWLFSDVENTATWKNLTNTDIDTLIANLKSIDLLANKLTAILAVSKSIIALGYEWLDKYFRELIAEAIYRGLETSIIAGTGLNEPIGMIKDLDNSINNVYQDKASIPLTSFSASEYGAILSTMTKNGTRSVGDVILVVNPSDYFEKIMPEIKYRNNIGDYVSSIPHPTEIIDSVVCPKGKIVIGIAKKYILGVSKIEIGRYKETLAQYDMDMYLGKIHGNGRPIDNYAFVVCDITDMGAGSAYADLDETKLDG